MKIAQVATCVYYEAMGPSNSIKGICSGLHANDVEVELHAIGEKDLFKELPQYAYYGYNPQKKVGMTLDVAFSPEMESGLMAAAQRIDIIHSNSLWSFPNVYPGLIVRRLKRLGGNKAGLRIPKLVTAPRGCFASWALNHSKWKKVLFGCLYGQYAALRATDMWHATCEKEYHEIRKLGYKQPVAIVPIGLDLPTIERKREEEGRFGHLRQLVFFGRIHKVKGCDRLVRAWAKLAMKNPSLADGWELVIAGPDCGALPQVMQLIDDLKVPRVKFVGELNGQAKYDFLAAADLYALPSFTENFGITIAEALACGVPVVVSRGTPWGGVEKEKCGRWVDNDPDSLADAFKELMSLTDEERRQMGERGREWIKRDFSWEGIGAKMKAAYEWLLSPETVARPEWVRVD